MKLGGCTIQRSQPSSWKEMLRAARWQKAWAEGSSGGLCSKRKAAGDQGQGIEGAERRALSPALGARALVWATRKGVVSGERGRRGRRGPNLRPVSAARVGACPDGARGAGEEARTAGRRLLSSASLISFPRLCSMI